MKVIKRILLCIILCIILCCIALLTVPELRTWLKNVFFNINYQSVAETISHELTETGELVCLEITDTDVLTASVNAALIPSSVATLTVNYQYDLSLGVDLSQAKTEVAEDGIAVYLPPAHVISDKITAVGDVQKSDFWHLIDETKYQQIMDKQLLECRSRYENDQDLLNQAWNKCCDTLKSLLSASIQHSEYIDIRFYSLSDYEPAQE